MQLRDIFEAQDYQAIFNFFDKLKAAVAADTTQSEKVHTTQLSGIESALDNQISPSEAISWAKNTLQRSDRITWYLKQVKGYKLYQLLNSNFDFTSAENQLIKQEMARIGFVFGGDMSLMNMMNGLAHWLSLKVAKIDSFVFDKQTPAELTAKFNEFENEYKEKSVGTVATNPDTAVFLKLGDGFAWYDLETSQDEEEACAMGHCGNAGNPQPGQTILSLRHDTKVGNEDRWKVCLTFILNENGTLGEMKGRGNEKPAEKYHQYIIPLLLDPRIKGIVGGGYLPKSNFSIWDLGDAEAKKLMEKKPSLCPIGEYIEHIGVDGYVQKQISNIFTFPVVVSGSQLILPLNESINQFFGAGQKANNAIGSTLKMISGDVLLSGEHRPTIRDIEDAMDGENTSRFLILAKQKFGKEAESTAENEVDFDDLGSVLEWMQAHEKSGLHVLYSVWAGAEENAIEAEAYTFVKDLLTETGIEISFDATILDGSGTEEYTGGGDYDLEATFITDGDFENKDVKVSVDLKEFLKIVGEASPEFAKIQSVRFTTGSREYDGLFPYYGFTGSNEFDNSFNSYLEDVGFDEIFKE